jgi:hypothetical protein
MMSAANGMETTMGENVLNAGNLIQILFLTVFFLSCLAHATRCAFRGRDNRLYWKIVATQLWLGLLCFFIGDVGAILTIGAGLLVVGMAGVVGRLGVDLIFQHRGQP